MCPQFLSQIPNFWTSHCLRNPPCNWDGRPHAPKSEGAHAGARTPLIGGVDRARAGPSGESCRRERAIPPGTPVGGPRHRAPPVLPGVADAGSKPHAAARVGRRGEMALHEGASLARAGSNARSICGAQGGGRRLSGAWEQVPRAGGGRDAGGPPSATRVTMLLVDVEERGPSPTSRRRRAACPPTPAAAPA